MIAVDAAAGAGNRAPRTRYRWAGPAGSGSHRTPKGDAMRVRLAIISILSSLSVLFLVPAPGAAQSADELAKQTQNPISSLISVPFQANWDFGLGDRKATSTLLNFQPVVPFAINRSTNVILRVIMPITSQPAPDGTRINGLGDIVTTAFFAPSRTGKVIWGAGPVFLLPTATNQAICGEKFGLGPSVVVLTQPGKWTLGFLANQIWSTSGAKDRPPVNQMYLQPFLAYNLGNGLSAGVGMEMSADWKKSEVLTAPLLFNISKVTMLGKRPVNLAVAAGPTVVAPTGGSSWRFRLSATFLFPRGQ